MRTDLVCPTCEEPVPPPLMQPPPELYYCENCKLTVPRKKLKTVQYNRLWLAGSGGGDDLNEAQTNALILNFFKGRGWRIPFDLNNGQHAGTASLAATPGVRSPAGVLTGLQKAWGLGYYVDTGAATNGVYEVAEQPLVFPSDGPPWAFPIYYAMTMNRGNLTSTAAGECFQGIGWGSILQITPWQTNYASSSHGPVMQCRWNFTTSLWELMIWDGDTGTAPLVETLTTQKAFLTDAVMPEIALSYTPPTPLSGGSGSRIDCYWNGILVHSLVNNDRVNGFPNNYQSTDLCATYFVTNGSTVGNTVSESRFYTPRVYNPMSFASV